MKEKFSKIDYSDLKAEGIDTNDLESLNEGYVIRENDRLKRGYPDQVTFSFDGYISRKIIRLIQACLDYAMEEIEANTKTYTLTIINEDNTKEQKDLYMKDALLSIQKAFKEYANLDLVEDIKTEGRISDSVRYCIRDLGQLIPDLHFNCPFKAVLKKHKENIIACNEPIYNTSKTTEGILLDPLSKRQKRFVENYGIHPMTLPILNKYLVAKLLEGMRLTVEASLCIVDYTESMVYDLDTGESTEKPFLERVSQVDECLVEYLKTGDVNKVVEGMQYYQEIFCGLWW